MKFTKNINGIPIVQDIEDAVRCLKEGKTLTRYEFGNSMNPIFFSGEYARIKPISSLKEITLGDAVLCEVNGKIMTHMVLDIDEYNNNNKFLIGATNPPFLQFGWTNKIYGIAESWAKYIGKRVIFEQNN